MEGIEKVLKFIEEAQTYYLATVEGDQPRVRPFGTILLANGRLYIQTGKVKDVYKQLKANPLVEIAACKPDGHWLRYTGKAVFETDTKYAQAMIRNAHLESIYNEQTGNKLMAFHLEDAKAVDIAVMGAGESLL